MAGLLDSREELDEYLRRMLSPPEPQQFDTGNVFQPLQFSSEYQAAGGRMPQSVTPQATLNLGPLALTGGAQFQQRTTDEGNPYTKVTPLFGAGMNDIPLLGGKAEAALKITPEQEKLFTAVWRKKLHDDALLSLTLQHMQPYEGQPNTQFGIRYQRKF